MDEKGSFKISRRAMYSKFEETEWREEKVWKLLNLKKRQKACKKNIQKTFLEKKNGLLEMIRKILTNNLKPTSGAIKSCFNKKILKQNHTVVV